MSNYLKSGYVYPRCYETHKPMPIGEYFIYGGSCARPVISSADVYVGFDLSMVKSELTYPWSTGFSFLFYIPDMGVPAEPIQFKNLIDWLELQLIANMNVHIGCIGGHGRTGMVLSALVKQMMGIDDAITYVRKNYCSKVVESAAQVNFLNTHYGIKKVLGAKELPKIARETVPKMTHVYPKGIHAPDIGKEDATYFKSVPVASKKCIWGLEILFDKP